MFVFFLLKGLQWWAQLARPPTEGGGLLITTGFLVKLDQINEKENKLNPTYKMSFHKRELITII